MARTKISEFSSTPANNTDIDSINIAEGCAPSGINDAIRELMSQLKDWQSGTSNDPYVVGSSGSLTLNQGTANGVAYLNGSKVVTSGSALTFDGTSLVGTGKFQPQVLRIKDASYSELYFSTADTGGNGAISYNHSLNAMAFYANGSEQMRLTSTGLGIGTSSPAYKLDVRGVLGSGNGTITSGFSYDSGGLVGTFSNHALGVLTNGNVVAKFDTSGNLGLGVTPSAWSSIFRVMQLGSDGAWVGGRTDSQNQAWLATNSHYNGTNWIYKATTSAGQFALAGNEFRFYQAPSGTAGNAITFTQAMSLTAAGALLVGATSAYSNSVRATFQGTQTGGGDGVVAIYNSESSSGDSSPPLALYKAMTTTSSSARFVQFYANGAGTPMGGIVGNGSSNVQFATLSDIREKTNIQPINGSLEKINALRPVEFDWIADGSHVNAGFVAQEVEIVFPEFVVENMANDGQEARKGLTGGMTGGIVAHLVKAIQELKAEFDEYKATHP